MSVTGALPMEVLAQEVSKAIRNRRVQSAVFTTFTFDPGFFELHILPILFDQPFSQVDKVRRMQLDDALRMINQLAVYYDRGALSQEATDAQLDYRRIDVRRATGVFHPKVVLLLVEEPPGEDKRDNDRVERWQSLIVVVSSANLTQAGWWENIECAHVEEIPERDIADSRSAFRPDLLSLIRRIRESAAPDDDHAALETIHRFLVKDTSTDRPARTSAWGRFYTRLFCGQGQQSLAQWLESLSIQRGEWNLEIISPFFDPNGAGPLPKLIELVKPKETRIYLPRDADGTAQVSKETYDAIAGLPGCAWARLPAEVMNRGRGSAGEKLAPRRVHAKVYRLWSRSSGDLLLIGSVNLTSSAHSHGGAGNLEAAFFVDVANEKYPRRWWLESFEKDPTRFVEEELTEADGLEPVPLDISFRFDWASGRLEYRFAATDRSGFRVSEVNGRSLFTIENPKTGTWHACPQEERLRNLFLSTSFLLVSHSKGTWRVLVREENMSQRPSLLHQLTPEEILEYWSLLTPAQRAEFVEEHLGFLVELEGIPVIRHDLIESRDTLFDRFAGIFHAFGCLRRSIEAALDEGQSREAESRLFGAKYDSLPHLLQKTLDRKEGDLIVRYVTFLCARQLRDQLKGRYREFVVSCAERATALDQLLTRLPEIRETVILSGVDDGEAFLKWYEPMFLKWLIDEGAAT